MLFLHLIGKSNVCTNCIAKHTIFKEIKTISEARLKRALLVFDINSFEDLKNLKAYDVVNLEKKPAKKKNNLKYKVVTKKDVDFEDMSEMDQLW